MFAVDIKLMRYLLSASLLMLAVASTSCGFQLRGALDIPTDAAPVHLQTNASFELAREVRQLLNSNAIKITEQPESANTDIVFQAENRQSRVLSVDSDGRAREYLLFYDVDIIIRSKRVGEEAYREKPERISLTRTLLFDQDAVLAVSNESAILYEDMRKQAARLILMKLQSGSRE